MKDVDLYCYTTNNEILGKKVKELSLKKIKDLDNLHSLTSLIASIQGLVSGALSLGSDFVSITLDNPSIGKNTFAKKVIMSVKFNPVLDLKNDPLDTSEDYKKITTKLTHDNFSKLSDKDYGLVLKYTTYLQCQDISNYKELSPKLVTIISEKISSGFCSRDFKVQIPIGRQFFNVKVNTIISY